MNLKKNDYQDIISRLPDSELNKLILKHLGWDMKFVTRTEAGDDLYHLHTPDGKPHKSPTIFPEQTWEYVGRYEQPYVNNLDLAVKLFDGEYRTGSLFGIVTDKIVVLPLSRPQVGKFQATCYSLKNPEFMSFATNDNPARAICEAVLEIVWREQKLNYPDLKESTVLIHVGN